MRHIRTSMSYGNVAAMLALVLAIGGGGAAVAATSGNHARAATTNLIAARVAHKDHVGHRGTQGLGCRQGTGGR